ncbi:MAG: hypothetical protein PHN84_10210 [Desulfuromonadaceae bacterium]|nr:hypothetical protein [Desulfuromonadaceae bacterium]MDD2855046.1 hypothetical protein [Desulfuromonadaceae bacterium]
MGADFLTKIELALQDIAAAPERWPIVRDNIRKAADPTISVFIVILN